jgi:hypothetical protein
MKKAGTKQVKTCCFNFFDTVDATLADDLAINCQTRRAQNAGFGNLHVIDYLFKFCGHGQFLDGAPRTLFEGFAVHAAWTKDLDFHPATH